jgi:toxoflavin synthase
MANYDKITKEYELATKRALREFAYLPTLKHFLNVKDKKVIDFGCGEGISSRIIKDLGATKVTGIDESLNQIIKAKEKDPEGNYYVGNAIDFKINDKFDVATAILVTTYIPTEEKLEQFFYNVST